MPNMQHRKGLEGRVWLYNKCLIQLVTLQMSKEVILQQTEQVGAHQQFGVHAAFCLSSCTLHKTYQETLG